MPTNAALAVPATAPDHLDVHYRSLEGLLFLAASLCYLPLLVYILVFQWNVLIERLTTPGQRREAKAPQRSSKEEWATVERLLGALSLNPLDSQRRRQLADTYVRLDLTQSAIGEFRKAIECIDRGYEQAYLLYKTAHLLADVQENIPAAVPLCRRIIRLYPKSYFAAYARRVVSHYEAHYMSQWR